MLSFAMYDVMLTTKS